MQSFWLYTCLLCLTQRVLFAAVILENMQQWNDDFSFSPQDADGWRMTKLSGFDLPVSTPPEVSVDGVTLKYHGPYPSSYQLTRSVRCELPGTHKLIVAFLVGYCNTDSADDEVQFSLVDTTDSSTVRSETIELSGIAELPLNATRLPAVQTRTSELYTNHASSTTTVPACGDSSWYTPAHSGPNGPFEGYDRVEINGISGQRDYDMSIDMLLDGADKYIVLHNLFMTCVQLIAPTTAAPTTTSPTTTEPTTAQPTTGAPTTPAPTTASPTTPEPTIASLTTSEPSTASPTTPAPTTSAPTTSTTEDTQTTVSATTTTTTASPTTPAPTTLSPTTPAPTTATPTSTSQATTPAPSTASPSTPAPTTSAPTTSTEEAETTTTPPPTTPSPTTRASTTREPTTSLESTTSTAARDSTTPASTSESDRRVDDEATTTSPPALVVNLTEPSPWYQHPIMYIIIVCIALALCFLALMCVAGVFWYRQQQRHKLKGYVDTGIYDREGKDGVQVGGVSFSRSGQHAVTIDVHMPPQTDDMELGTGTNTTTALDSGDVESDANLMRYDALPDRDQQHPAHQRAISSNLPALPATNEVDIVKYLDAVGLAGPMFAGGVGGYMNGEPHATAISEPTETGTEMTETQTTHTRFQESKHEEYEVYGAVQRHDDDDGDSELDDDEEDGDSEEMYVPSNNASRTTDGYQAVNNPGTEAARNYEQKEGSEEDGDDYEDNVNASQDHMNDEETDFETDSDSHSRQT